MRARYPSTQGFVERNRAKIFYEVYENEGPTILLARSWPDLLHMRDQQQRMSRYPSHPEQRSHPLRPQKP